MRGEWQPLIEPFTRNFQPQRKGAADEQAAPAETTVETDVRDNEIRGNCVTRPSAGTVIPAPVGETTVPVKIPDEICSAQTETRKQCRVRSTAAKRRRRRSKCNNLVHAGLDSGFSPQPLEMLNDHDPPPGSDTSVDPLAVETFDSHGLANSRCRQAVVFVDSVINPNVRRVRKRAQRRQGSLEVDGSTPLNALPNGENMNAASSDDQPATLTPSGVTPRRKQHTKLVPINWAELWSHDRIVTAQNADAAGAAVKIQVLAGSVTTKKLKNLTPIAC